jgi:predicted metal-dependent hydrolase
MPSPTERPRRTATPGTPDPVTNPEHRPATAERPPLEIHRSPRRRRSASAAFRDDRIVVRLPAGLPPAEERRLLDVVVRKVTSRHRTRDTGGDEALTNRAGFLADTYLDGVRASRVTWSTRMGSRYGSCTPTDGTIRISSELAAHPAFVRDYVLVHELAHLQSSGHGPAFHALVARFPEAERARGYLEGYQAGRYRAAQQPGGADEPGGVQRLSAAKPAADRAGQLDLGDELRSP